MDNAKIILLGQTHVSVQIGDIRSELLHGDIDVKIVRMGISRHLFATTSLIRDGLDEHTGA